VGVHLIAMQGHSLDRKALPTTTVLNSQGFYFCMTLQSKPAQ